MELEFIQKANEIEKKHAVELADANRKLQREITERERAEKRIQLLSKMIIKQTDDENMLITRFIEFPTEYHEAGISILNYFATVLRKKYPNKKAKIRLEQDGLKVSMIIDPLDGGDKEIIEKTLDEYGLVISGKMLPEEFTNDKLLLIELKSELRAARDKIEMQRELLQYQGDQNKKKDIQIERFLAIVEEAIKNPGKVINTRNIRIDGSVTESRLISGDENGFETE